MDSLLDRARAATSKRGLRTVLAGHLRIPTSRLSEYLAPDPLHQPGGDITLRMLAWVEQMERESSQKHYATL